MKKFFAKFSIKEIFKFCVGGGSAVVIDFTVYMILRQFIPISASKAISFIAGAIVGFIINKLWTFESKNFQTAEVLKYVILYACSATVNTLVNAGVLKIVDWMLFAYLCATGTSTIMNFIGQKFFVFKKDSVDMQIS